MNEEQVLGHARQTAVGAQMPVKPTTMNGLEEQLEVLGEANERIRVLVERIGVALDQPSPPTELANRLAPGNTAVPESLLIRLAGKIDRELRAAKAIEDHLAAIANRI